MPGHVWPICSTPATPRARFGPTPATVPRRTRTSCASGCSCHIHRKKPAGRSMPDRTARALMALSGFINPYPGKLGVVEEGALADLLLVEGNPLEKLDLVADPDKNFLVIMKDGKISKNTLTP